MKTFAILIVVIVAVIILWSGIDVGRTAIVNHRMTHIEGL